MRGRKPAFGAIILGKKKASLGEKLNLSKPLIFRHNQYSWYRRWI
jgi:hypothetical protein